MKIKTLFSIAGLALALTSVSASALSLYTSPNINDLEDDDRDTLTTDLNSNGLLDVGDTLTAILDFGKLIELDQNQLETGNFQDLAELTGYTEITITEKLEISPGVYHYSFEGSAAMQAQYGAGAMIALYTDAANNLNISTNPTCTSAGACAPLATDGDLWAVLGISDADDEWFSTGTDNFAAAANGTATTVFANVNFALSLIGGSLQTSGYTFPTLQLDCLPNVLFDCLGDGRAQFIGSSSILGGRGLDGNTVRSDSDILFQAVPEPEAIFTLAIGLLGLGFSKRRQSL